MVSGAFISAYQARIPSPCNLLTKKKKPAAPPPKCRKGSGPVSTHLQTCPYATRGRGSGVVNKFRTCHVDTVMPVAHGTGSSKGTSVSSGAE